MMRDHPIFGTGLSGFQRSINPYRGDYTENLQYPHNIVLNFWTETGILGLVAFIVLLYKIFFTLLKKMYHKSPIFALGFISIFTYWVIHGLVDVPYFKNDLSMEFWFFVAIFE